VRLKTAIVVRKIQIACIPEKNFTFSIMNCVFLNLDWSTEAVGSRWVARFFETPGRQIFADALRKQNVDWAPIIDRWNSLSDAMIDDYGRDLPPSGSGLPLLLRMLVRKFVRRETTFRG
jgi:hypothetical protein